MLYISNSMEAQFYHYLWSSVYILLKPLIFIKLLYIGTGVIVASKSVGVEKKSWIQVGQEIERIRLWWPCSKICRRQTIKADRRSEEGTEGLTGHQRFMVPEGYY